MRALASITFVVLAITGCASNAPPKTVDGTWSGLDNGQNFTLHLAATGDALTGSAVIDPGNLTGEPFAGTVTGALADQGQSIAFTITTSGGSVAFSGAFADADDFDGYLNGSGWNAAWIVFSR